MWNSSRKVIKICIGGMERKQYARINPNEQANTTTATKKMPALSPGGLPPGARKLMESTGNRKAKTQSNPIATATNSVAPSEYRTIGLDTGCRTASVFMIT